MRYPRRLLNDGEVVIDHFRPHWRELRGVIGWAIGLASVAGATMAALGERWWGLTVAAAFLLWCLLSSRRLLQWWFTHYVLTTQRVILRRGAFARRRVDIPLEKVSRVSCTQSLMGRLLGHGRITIESIEPGELLEFHAVGDPATFESMIHAARGAARPFRG